MCTNGKKPLNLSPSSPFPRSISLEDKSEGDCLHQWGYQDHPWNKEQNNLQAEWPDGKGSEEDCALAQRWPPVYLRWDERHQCPLLGDGAKASWGTSDHLAKAVAERAAGFQAVLPQHPQTAVLVALALAASSTSVPPAPSCFGPSEPLDAMGMRHGNCPPRGERALHFVHRIKCNKKNYDYFWEVLQYLA